MATKTIYQIDKACTTFKKLFKSKIAKFEKLDNWLEKESNVFEDETKNKNSLFLKYKKEQLIKVDFGVNVGTKLSHTHFAVYGK